MHVAYRSRGWCRGFLVLVAMLGAWRRAVVCVWYGLIRVVVCWLSEFSVSPIVVAGFEASGKLVSSVKKLRSPGYDPYQNSISLV